MSPCGKHSDQGVNIDQSAETLTRIKGIKKSMNQPFALKDFDDMMEEDIEEDIQKSQNKICTFEEINWEDPFPTAKMQDSVLTRKPMKYILERIEEEG